MSYSIIIAKSASKDFEKLTPDDQQAAREAIGKYLYNKPKKPVKTRIKKLVGLRKPQYRLRAGNLRVFYDVNEGLKRVEVLAFIQKSAANRWLKKKGITK